MQQEVIIQSSSSSSQYKRQDYSIVTIFRQFELIIFCSIVPSTIKLHLKVSDTDYLNRNNFCWPMLSFYYKHQEKNSDWISIQQQLRHHNITLQSTYYEVMPKQGFILQQSLKIESKASFYDFKRKIINHLGPKLPSDFLSFVSKEISKESEKISQWVQDKLNINPRNYTRIESEQPSQNSADSNRIIISIHELIFENPTNKHRNKLQDQQFQDMEDSQKWWKEFISYAYFKQGKISYLINLQRTQIYIQIEFKDKGDLIDYYKMSQLFNINIPALQRRQTFAIHPQQSFQIETLELAIQICHQEKIKMLEKLHIDYFYRPIKLKPPSNPSKQLCFFGQLCKILQQSHNYCEVIQKYEQQIVSKLQGLVCEKKELFHRSNNKPLQKFIWLILQQDKDIRGNNKNSQNINYKNVLRNSPLNNHFSKIMDLLAELIDNNIDILETQKPQLKIFDLQDFKQVYKAQLNKDPSTINEILFDKSRQGTTKQLFESLIKLQKKSTNCKQFMKFTYLPQEQNIIWRPQSLLQQRFYQQQLNLLFMGNNEAFSISIFQHPKCIECEQKQLSKEIKKHMQTGGIILFVERQLHNEVRMQGYRLTHQEQEKYQSQLEQLVRKNQIEHCCTSIKDKNFKISYVPIFKKNEDTQHMILRVKFVSRKYQKTFRNNSIQL